MEMRADQRFLFDMAGFLHLPGALHGEPLAAAQAAAARYVDGLSENPPFASAPPGFGFGTAQSTAGKDRVGQDLTVLPHGFAFDPALEACVHHPSTWPIIMEFTHGRPRFTGGSLMLNTHGQWFHPIHAGWTPEQGHRPDFRRLYVEDGRVRCTDFVCFFYLTDVHPGDGGLIQGCDMLTRGGGGKGCPLAWRSHRVPTHFPLILHAI
jgi:hypothetical protein